VSAKLVERFGDFALGFGCQVFPHRAAGQAYLRWNGIVGIYRVAIMNEEIRFQLPHRFVDAHAAQIRIDSVTLSRGIPRPQKTNVTRTEWRRAKVAQSRLAQSAAIAV